MDDDFGAQAFEDDEPGWGSDDSYDSGENVDYVSDVSDEGSEMGSSDSDLPAML